MTNVSRKLTAIGVAISMCSTPAMATASALTPAPTQAISPMIALSIFGSQASAAALCGSAATAATASAAATQAPAPGCVLPIGDPPVAPLAEVMPPPPPPAPSGFGISPILLGLAGIAILAALIASQDDDNDNEPPVSPN